MARPCKPFARAAAIKSSGLDTPSPEKKVCACRSMFSGIGLRLIESATNQKCAFHPLCATTGKPFFPPPAYTDWQRSETSIKQTNNGQSPARTSREGLCPKMRKINMNRSISIAVALAAVGVTLAVLPTARAVSPPPDGNYNSGVTAEGNNALFSSAGGVWNTALGAETLYNTTTGNSNTAAGVRALFSNINGSNNVAYGIYALYSTTSASNNIAIGDFAGLNLTTESNCIDIGSRGEAGESSSIRIGTEGTQLSAYMAGIFGVPVSGNSVCVD